MSVFLCNAADDPDREREHIEQLLAKRVDGIIVTGRRADPRPPLDFAGALGAGALRVRASATIRRRSACCRTIAAAGGWPAST